MGIVKNILNNLSIRNAVQQVDNLNSKYINRDIDYFNPYTEYHKHNKNGRYDNYFDNTNRIVTGAAKYPFYYVVDDKVLEPDKSKFAYYLNNFNESYSQHKMLEKIYTELITHGHSDIFIWRKNGSNETNLFESGKQYKEDDFRGITLVSGYDKGKLTAAELKNIVTITYGASQSNVFLGYSPSQAAESWRKMQDEMGLHMTSFAKNAGMPLGTFMITASSIEEYVKIKEKLDKKVVGAKNNGKVLFSYKPSDSTQAQIEWISFTSQNVQDYTKQLEFSDKKISKDFGVPGTIKGSNDGENYATASVSKQNFVEWTIKPLVDTVRDQLEFFISRRFDIKGEIKCDIEVPDVADESLVRINATTAQVALFDQKIGEGYTAESIVKAYNLPERFLLLEKASNSSSNKSSTNHAHNHTHNKADNDLEYIRQYQNEFTDEQRKEIESKFTSIIDDYTQYIIKNGNNDAATAAFETKMANEYASQFSKLYNVNIDSVADALADVLGSVDADLLSLTDEELEQAVSQYNERVSSFSTSFAAQIEALEGDTLEVKTEKAQPSIKRVAVTESEHTRIVSELQGWTKAQEEFPARVYKTWHTQNDSRVCPNCLEMKGTTIDVTALFINDPNIDEIYEVQGGGLHPNCRCFCRYEVEAE